MRETDHRDEAELIGDPNTVRSLSLAWGHDTSRAETLAWGVMHKPDVVGDTTTIDDTFVLMLARLPFDPDRLVAFASACRTAWTQVISGHLPWAGIVHTFPVDLDADGVRSNEPVHLTCLMDARCLVVAACLETGEPIGEELAVQRHAGHATGTVDPEPEPVAIARRLLDAAVTEVALARLAGGEHPILQIRDIAQECDIALDEDREDDTTIPGTVRFS